MLCLNSAIFGQTVVISQVYSGGGLTSGTPTYRTDYVELLNTGASPVSLNGLYLQYASASGAFGSASTLIYTLPTSATLQPGKYYLVQLGTVGTVGAVLPVTPDTATTNLNMAQASGKVALTNTGVALGCGATATPCSLPDSRIIDLVSWGASNNAEGGVTVNNGAAFVNTQGSVRKSNGCQDTNVNNADFDVVTNPVPRNSASAANPCVALSNIDLTISHDTSSTTVNLGDTVIYDLTVSNLGLDSANGVKVNFPIPPNLIGAPTSNGVALPCGFSMSQVGNLVTFTGGTIPAGGNCNLQVSATAQNAGIIATSLGVNTKVDPDNTITETNETNNSAATDLEVRVQFPTTVVGLFGRASLADLLADINNIGGATTVVLDQNLVETSNIVVPDGITLDFVNFTVSGSITFTFGSGDGAGFRTANINGLGNAENPGSLQVSQVIFNGFTDVEYYQIPLTDSKLGGLPQTAYNHPASVNDFRINNPEGLIILAPFSVLGDFYLTNGIIFNGINNITLSIFSRNNGENGSGGSEISFVAGPVTKILPFFERNVDSGFAANYIFPVGTVGGTENGYSPLRISNFTSGSLNSSLTVQAFDTNSPGVPTPSLSRFWQITELGDVTTDLQFFWRAGDDTAITIPAEATIIRNGQVACDQNCTLDFLNRNASITGISQFSPWSVAQTTVTAAGASLSGRVLNVRGVPQARAKVLVTDQNGNTQTIMTNNFGNYRFDGLRAGETYIVNVIVKQAQYNSRIVTLNEDISDIDFIPQD